MIFHDGHEQGMAGGGIVVVVRIDRRRENEKKKAPVRGRVLSHSVPQPHELPKPHDGYLAIRGRGHRAMPLTVPANSPSLHEFLERQESRRSYTSSCLDRKSGLPNRVAPIGSM